MAAMDHLRAFDSELFDAIRAEESRQLEKLELIASENFASPAVLEAAGSVLTDKYAEGYPGRRYYGGCEYVDVAENLARDRAKALFGADHANVQPHSGSSANLAVYVTVLKPGDTIMGMDLAHGGHLTHGAPVSLSGILYHSVSYGVRRDDETIDYDAARRIAEENRPRLIIAGASAYSRVIDFDRFRAIADAVGAYLLVDMAHIAGLVAAKVHPSPVAVADFVTSTTHKTLRGPRGGLVLIGKDRDNALGQVAAKSGRTKRYSELLDSAVMPGIQGGPLMHIIAAKAVALREAASPAFAAYQQQVVANARALSQHLAESGLRIVSGGTDNHLMLVDVSSTGLSGREVEVMLDQANITANKNGIPFDTRGATVTSGIRLGTPALTSRGMGEADMATVGGFIVDVIESGGDSRRLAAVRDAVRAFCSRFPRRADFADLM